MSPRARIGHLTKRPRGAVSSRRIAATESPEAVIGLRLHRATMSRTIWIDVEDLFLYTRHNSRPSGIQRFQFELCRCLATGPTSDRVRFVRHSQAGGTLVVVPFAALSSAVEAMALEQDCAPVAPVSKDIQERPTLARRLARSLPSSVRVPLSGFYLHQVQAWRSLHVLWRDPGDIDGADESAPSAPAPSRLPSPEEDAFTGEVKPGDALVVMGAPWFEGHADMIERVRREHALRFVLIVHDIIVLRRPEWCQASMVRDVSAWMGRVLPLADVLLTISQATATDLARYAVATGMPLRARPVPIPVGNGFTASQPAIRGKQHDFAELGDFVLVVSTIEVRKNHALLLRVWRRLLSELPAPDVPKLVFAGRVGWLVQDLMAQLTTSDFLGGKVVLIETPTDADLEALYRGCLFTAFPSFYEGWGLPVTESLSFGCPCVISDATSLPEAGGSFARYFDPEDGNAAYRVILDTLADRGGLAAWRARIAREYVPARWEQSADAVVAALDA